MSWPIALGVCQAPPARRGAFGFTLMEVLVTLVLISMVAAILFEGLFQTGQIEHRMERNQAHAQSAALRDVWVQQALEGLLPGQAETPERFVGTERELRGLSTLPLSFSELGPEQLSLSLRASNQAAGTELIYASLGPQPADSAGKPPLVLRQWPQGKLRWRYLDDVGQWQDNWPPVSERHRTLPRAIALLHDDTVLLLASPASPGDSLGRRQDVDKLP